MFIDREAELADLERHFAADGAALIVLYGRRRVGKTELLRTFCGGKPHVYFVATLGADAGQLEAFSQAVWAFDHDRVPDGFTFPSWEAAFEALADLPGRPIVVLDEFTYLISGNKALPSVLQKVWDARLRHASPYLVLCGSYIGMMERDVLGQGAPLYGRRTGGFFLRPLEPPAAGAFFPRYDPVQRIEAWSVLGGMPYYLSAFDDHRPVLENARAVILERRGLLHDEPSLLLLEELREPRNYFSVLRAIAHGNTRLNEIAQAARVGDPRTAARYLDLLQQMQLVRRHVPATEPRPEKSRRGIYAIDDAFLRFWFRFVHPHRGALELGLADAVLEQRVIPHFAQHVAQAFEEAARRHVARLARAGRLPFLPQRIGGWWHRDAEVDVLAVSDSDGAMLLGECKWSKRRVGADVFLDLQRKVALVDPEGRWPHVSYAVFGRSGFSDALRELAAAERALLVGPAEIASPDGLE